MGRCNRKFKKSYNWNLASNLYILDQGREENLGVRFIKKVKTSNNYRKNKKREF